MGKKTEYLGDEVINLVLNPATTRVLGRVASLPWGKAVDVADGLSGRALGLTMSGVHASKALPRLVRTGNFSLPEPDPRTPEGQKELLERDITKRADDIKDLENGHKIVLDIFREWLPIRKEISAKESEQLRAANPGRTIYSRSELELACDFGDELVKRLSDGGVQSHYAINNGMNAILETISMEPPVDPLSGRVSENSAP